MADTTNIENEENNEVQKTLKQLPKVKASSDFETRLQRRIASQEHEEQNVFFPRRIPVFAYSLVSILVVGVAAYFVIIRNTSVEPLVQKQRVVLEDTQSRVQQPPANTSLHGELDQQKVEAVTSDNSSSTAEVSSQNMPRENEGASGAISTERVPLSTGEGSKQVMAPQSDKKKDIDEVKPIEATQATKTREPEKRAVPATVPDINKKILSNAPMYSPSKSMYSLVDSVAIRDSLRFDSLRRTKQIKSIQKKPQK